MSVSGVGDQAVYVPGLGELWFLKGDLSLTVKAIGLNVAVTLDGVRPLALKVLARMSLRVEDRRDGALLRNIAMR